MKRRSVMIAVALAQLTTSPLVAQPAASAKESDREGEILVEGEKADPDLDKVICKSDKMIGSRLKTAKRCQTKRQWDAERLANRQDIEKIQSARSKSN